MNNIEKGMGEPKSPDKQEDVLRSRIANMLEIVKKQGHVFKKPDEEIIESLVQEFKGKYPEEEAPTIPYAEWNAEEQKFELVDKPKEWGSESRIIGRKE